MLTLALNVGMASKYLVTNPDKMIAIKENPYLFLSNEKLNIKAFSECLSTIYNQSNSSFLKLGSRKIDAPQFEIFLDDLINERKPSIPFPSFSNPILLISNGIDHKALVSMKVLKIRGICDLLAIDVSVSDTDSIFRLGNELKNEELGKRDFYTLFKPPKRLSIVSGVAKTVISTEQNTNQILRNFPDLISKYDKTAVQEPLF